MVKMKFAQKINILDEIIKNPAIIKQVQNPTEQFNRQAVQLDGRNIRYINNPSKLIQEEAIKRAPDAIRYIKRPDEEIKHLAVSIRPESIEHIKVQSEKLRIMAVRKQPFSIKYIKDPSKVVQLEAFAAHFRKYHTKIIPLENTNKGFLLSLGAKKRTRFFEELPHYKEELENMLYFSNMLQYILEYRKDWAESFIEALSPLTTKQESFWKKHRLKTLY